MKNKIEMYCITHKRVSFLEDLDYILVNVGSDNISKKYLNCDTGENIIKKEKYYSELTFHYWFWKNKLDINKDNWVGFCQRRRFWTKKKINSQLINSLIVKENLLKEIPINCENFDSFLCEREHVNKIKKIKMIKKGLKSLIKNPRILFDINKQTLKFQFEMQHGYDILDKAIDLLDSKDKYDFRKYMEESTSFSAHNMFITKPKILNDWYKNIFKWLSKCESVLGFDFKNYETRTYAYLSERYISYWFKKYTNCKELPWIFFEEHK